jgi:hypothetical protein
LLSLVLEPKAAAILGKILAEELPIKDGKWGSHVTQIYKPEQLNQLLALEDDD